MGKFKIWETSRLNLLLESFEGHGRSLSGTSAILGCSLRFTENDAAELFVVQSAVSIDVIGVEEGLEVGRVDDNSHLSNGLFEAWVLDLSTVGNVEELECLD